MTHLSRICLLAIAVSLFAGCHRSRKFSYSVSHRLHPSRPAITGLDGGRARNICVIMMDDSSKGEFVEDELVFHPKDQAELKAFMDKYHAVVLRNDTPVAISGMHQVKSPKYSGWYLMRVDPQLSPVADFEDNMRQSKREGKATFSSETGVRLAAILAREATYKLGLNLLFQPQQNILETNTLEHPLDNTGKNFLNTNTLIWMTDKSTQSNSLDIGVIKAWDYCRYKGFPPTNGTWEPPVVAIIDQGFDLDPATGLPLHGNIDYHFLGGKPMQINLDDVTTPVGGPGWPGVSAATWHGQEVFGIAAAYPRNEFGIAGTGGDIVMPLLIQFDGTAAMGGNAVLAAYFNGASVINMSFDVGCANSFCRAFDFSSIDNFQGDINIAATGNVVLVSAAGNNGQQLNDQYDFVPATLNNILAVGAMQISNRQAEPFSNFGPKVGIWAPDGIFSTPTPSSDAANPNRPVGQSELPIFSGTSGASPFVAGVVGLMKVLKPSLSNLDVLPILQSTALPSPDPKVTPGYIDAFHAVLAVSPNIPPTIQIITPTNGQTVFAGSMPYLSSVVDDPEQSPRVDGVTVTWVSNIDGVLVQGGNGINGIAEVSKVALHAGTHTITATVTDPFGASSSASVTLLVNAGAPPVASIDYPPNGATFFDNQQINFRGSGTSSTGFITAYSYAWNSDISGVLPSGNNIWTTLTAGANKITLNLTDPYGQTGQASVTINVQHASVAYPTAKILTPLDGALIQANTLVNLQGIGTDPMDGTLTGASLSWTDNIDGFLGTGNSINKVLSGPPTNCGFAYHKITLTVTNSGGRTSTFTITLNIGQVC